MGVCAPPEWNISQVAMTVVVNRAQGLRELPETPPLSVSFSNLLGGSWLSVFKRGFWKCAAVLLAPAGENSLLLPGTVDLLMDFCYSRACYGEATEQIACCKWHVEENKQGGCDFCGSVLQEGTLATRWLMHSDQITDEWITKTCDFRSVPAVPGCRISVHVVVEIKMLVVGTLVLSQTSAC